MILSIIGKSGPEVVLQYKHSPVGEWKSALIAAANTQFKWHEGALLHMIRVLCTSVKVPLMLKT